MTPSRHPACQPASRPASQPARQPARQPASRPASRPASQPASQLIRMIIIMIITSCQQPDPPTNKPTIQRTRPIKPPSYRANKTPAPHLNTRATYFSSDVLRRGRRQRRSLQNPATEPCEVWGRVWSCIVLFTNFTHAPRCASSPPPRVYAGRGHPSVIFTCNLEKGQVVALGHSPTWGFTTQ